MVIQKLTVGVFVVVQKLTVGAFVVVQEATLAVGCCDAVINEIYTRYRLCKLFSTSLNLKGQVQVTSYVWVGGWNGLYTHSCTCPCTDKSI